MSETWHVKKAGPSLSIEDMIARMLGPEFVFEEFDPARPLAQQVGEANVLLVRSVKGDVVPVFPLSAPFM